LGTPFGQSNAIEEFLFNQLVQSWIIGRSAGRNLQTLSSAGEREEVGEKVELSRHIAAEDVTRSNWEGKNGEDESQKDSNFGDENAEGCQLVDREVFLAC